MENGASLMTLCWGEDAHLAQFLHHAIGVALPDEPARQALAAHIGLDIGAIAADARRCERPAIDVGREDLHLRRGIHPRHLLAEKDGDGISFFASCATEHPDAHLLPRALAFEYLRDDLGLQDLKFALVPEEFGDADQKVVEEVLDFVLIVAQEIDIGGDFVDLDHLHAPLHAAQEGVLLVAVEIVSGLVAQNVGDA